MSTLTKIEWTESTWNPVVGCTKVSEGCRNCYAERMSARLARMADADRQKGREPKGKREYRNVVRRDGAGLPLPQWNNVVRLIDDALTIPLRWRKPRRIFVCSMSDLFHKDVPFEFIDRVFAVMALCPQHTFQVLTKSPERMADYFARPGYQDAAAGYVCKEAISKAIISWHEAQRPDYTLSNRLSVHPLDAAQKLRMWQTWPLPGVWLGTSVEDQAAADARIPHLLRCPAAVRFLSVEPMLGEVDIGMSTATCKCCERWPSRWVRLHRPVGPDIPHIARSPENRVADSGIHRAESNAHGALSIRTPGGKLGIKPDEFTCLPSIDWVICGGESGPGARPMHPDWARSLRDQCVASGVPFFFKQWGAWVPESQIPLESARTVLGTRSSYKRLSIPVIRFEKHHGMTFARVGKKAAGRLLDGRTWDEMPTTKEPNDAK